MTDVAIYGASGQARSIAEIVRFQSEKDSLDFVAYVSDAAEDLGKTVDERPVISLTACLEQYPQCRMILGVGAPKSKAALEARVVAAGGAFLRGVWDVTVGLRSPLEIGEGTYVGYGTYIGPSCSIGRHVSLMTNCSIGHDVRIGDFCTICPTTTISGNVIVEDGVFLGAGSVIINGSTTKPLVIGSGAQISAGAVVTKSVASGDTMLGNPAQTLREWAKQRASSRRTAS